MTLPANTSYVKILFSFGSQWNVNDEMDFDDMLIVKQATLASWILSDTTYSAIEPRFDSFNTINEIIFMAVLPSAGDTASETLTIGPFQEATSIMEWGRYSKEISVQGYGTDPAPGGVAGSGLAALINSIFNANSKPKVRVNQLKLPVTDVTSLQRSLIDIYDIAQVINATKNINEYSKVSGIKNTIDLDRWDIDLVFDDIESVAGSVSVETPQNYPAKTRSRLIWGDIGPSVGSVAPGTDAPLWTQSGMTIPAGARLALVKFESRARATANAACTWYMTTAKGDGSFLVIDTVRCHNQNDTTDDMGFTMLTIVDLAELVVNGVGVSTFYIRVNCSNDGASGSAINTHPGNMTITWL
jgi:hypothetical protein